MTSPLRYSSLSMLASSFLSFNGTGSAFILFAFFLEKNIQRLPCSSCISRRKPPPRTFRLEVLTRLVTLKAGTPSGPIKNNIGWDRSYKRKCNPLVESENDRRSIASSHATSNRSSPSTRSTQSGCRSPFDYNSSGLAPLSADPYIDLWRSAPHRSCWLHTGSRDSLY